MGRMHHQQHNSDATRCQYLTLMLQTINKWSISDNMIQCEGVRQKWIRHILRIIRRDCQCNGGILSPHLPEDLSWLKLFCFISNCFQWIAQNIYSMYIYIYTEQYQRKIFEYIIHTIWIWISKHQIAMKISGSRWCNGSELVDRPRGC